MRSADPARGLRRLPVNRRLPWWRQARICCSQPTFAYSLMLTLVGSGFLLASPIVDPDLAFVGSILVATAIFMHAMFWALAYRAFGRDRA